MADRPLKIGFVAERMLRGFGVDLVIDRVASGLAAAGHEVTVYASVTDDTYPDSGYRFRQIPTRTSPFFPRYDLAASRHLRLLNREGNDLYFIETFPFFSYLPWLKAPAVAVDHGISSTEGFPLKVRANFAYVKLMQQRLYFRSARRIVTVSEYLKTLLPEGLRPRTRVIYNGADHYPWAEDGAGEKLRRQLGVKPGEVLLLYVGRLSSADQPYKGTAELAEMARRLRRANPKLRLLMVGFGGQRERNWLEKTGALVITNAPAQQMPAIYSACDVYVTASRWEGFDLPVVEAQSFGKPVAALDIGAHPEVMEPGVTGLLAASLGELEDAIGRLGAEPQLRAGMGAAARELAARFTWERAVGQYLELAEEVTRG